VVIIPARFEQKRRLFIGGLIIVALLRCVFWDRYSLCYTSRATCAGITLRNTVHTEHTGNGTPATGPPDAHIPD